MIIMAATLQNPTFFPNIAENPKFVGLRPPGFAL